MNKQEIYNYLNSKNIKYEIINHLPVYNMFDLEKVNLPNKEYDAKNLFIRDDKKINYYLITVKGNKKINLKEFRKVNNTRPLTFASDLDLLNILNLKPGSVTPLGLLNDKKIQVKFYLDDEFDLDSYIYVHPNDNTVTISLKVLDLINIIKEHGNLTNVIKLWKKIT